LKAEEQYRTMAALLKKLDIPVSDMPSWKAVTHAFTSEIFDKALHLEGPVLLLISPTSYEFKIDAINRHLFSNPKISIQIDAIKDYELWNGGKRESEKKWRVVMVDGMGEIQRDPVLHRSRNFGTSHDFLKALVHKYQGEGFDVVNDLHVYLTLLIKALASNQPIDEGTMTVLNAKNLNAPARYSTGRWDSYEKKIFLHYGDSSKYNGYLRLRRLVDFPIA